ncbi:ricin B lectin domain-containing protein [Irpex rosettiformis]|uniref:Ricin B lectin domain-containing protein n=1 Tax=Irpex rosettiformis TaxID=378272 RepID=A0ACB8U5D0_9APHY|nr:ricin B lectin domain-containing protein [Irpex rosettiformis]
MGGAVKVEDGVYRIQNAKALSSFVTMDVSLSLAPTYVFGYNWIDSDTQKWRIRKMGTGCYTLKNVGTDKFLAVLKEPNGGDIVYGTKTPTQWNFWETKIVRSACRIFVGTGNMNADLSNWGDSTPGTKIELWDWCGDNNRPNQCWFLEKLDEQKETAPNPPPQSTSASDKAPVSPGSETSTLMQDHTSLLGTPTPDPRNDSSSNRLDNSNFSLGTTRSTSETATVTVTEDDDFIVTTRTTETKTTIVTRALKPEK